MNLKDMKLEDKKPVVYTPLKAIRKKCLDCSNNQYKDVKLCPIVRCSLWPYRFGKRPDKSIFDDKE